jgi:hypothetical protein
MIKLAAVVLLGLLAASAFGQDRRTGRYAFVPVEQGTLRLDTETGDVSLCSGTGDALTCRSVAAGGADSRVDVRRLETRIADLERRISAVERKPTGEPEAGLPDDETIDRMMVLSERIMRRFFGIVRDIKQDFEQDSL